MSTAMAIKPTISAMPTVLMGPINPTMAAVFSYGEVQGIAFLAHGYHLDQEWWEHLDAGHRLR